LDISDSFLGQDQVSAKCSQLQLQHAAGNTARAADRAPPLVHEVGVQAMGQRNPGHRGARLPTLIQYALLESIVMASTRRAGSAWSFWHGVHFGSWWTPSSRYRFSGSRRVRWTLTLSCVGVALLMLLRGKLRQDRQYLASRKEQAALQFAQVRVAAADPAYSLNGATAEVVHEEENVKRTDGLVQHYSLTRYVRNEHGEYFMLLSTEGAPFVKHVSQSAAKVVLKGKYRGPNNDG
jgi:hypothetical protein